MKKKSPLFPFIFIYASLILMYCVLHGFEYSYYRFESDLVSWLSSDQDLLMKYLYDGCSFFTTLFITGNIYYQIMEASYRHAVSMPYFTLQNRVNLDYLRALSWMFALLTSMLLIESYYGCIEAPFLLYYRTPAAFPLVPLSFPAAFITMGEDFLPILQNMPTAWISIKDLVIFLILGCYAAVYLLLSPLMEKWTPDADTYRANKTQNKKTVSYTVFIPHILFSIIFLPASLLNFLYILVVGKSNIEIYRDKFPIYLMMHKRPEKKDSFLNSIFSESDQLPLALILSFLYITIIRYGSVTELLRGVYKTINILIFLLLINIIFLVLFVNNNREILISISDNPSESDDLEKEVLALHNSYLQTYRELQSLQKEYDKVVQNDRNWMNLFLHVLVNKSKGFVNTINEYEDTGFIPYEKLKPGTEAFEQIVYKCCLLGQAIASKKPTPVEKLPAFFIKKYRDSTGHFQNQLKPYITSGRIHLNMHGLENEPINIDLAKVQAIIEIILTNAIENALPNTIISIDYAEDKDKHTLTVSNIIDSKKEENIQRKLTVINEFWNQRNQDDSSLRYNNVSLGLILAKIYAETMDAAFTYNIEDHFRFVARLTV